MYTSALIPYGGYHVGPRRTVTVNLCRPRFSPEGLHINVDGSTHVLPWGVVNLDVPADRPVTITVFQLAQHITGLATIVVPPGPSAELEYRSTGFFGGSHYNARGQIGPPGSFPAPYRDHTLRNRLLVVILVPIATVVLFVVVMAVLIAILAAAAA
ncbi:hypothetical protein [Pseudonocardia sp. TRM90224]|uniref:hypothetical protein n=1 Tax=Pseudonocardia sp. TRM90224 TaxID=2812678 RepID=UPI001E3F47A1|nr:hypothetical protein [Pseudonocardia sp. TRM90224]